MRSRPARADGNLDQHTGSLLSARGDDVLGAAQIRRLTSIPVSHAKRIDTRGISGAALARPSTTRGRWRMAGRGTLGAAPRDGAISRLGD